MPTAPTVTSAWIMMLITLTRQADQELKRHGHPTLDRAAEGSSSATPACNCLQLFGVKAPVAAFMADSPRLLAWSVSDRIWSWKNSDWILAASCMSLA